MFSTWIGVVLLFAFFGLLVLVVFRAAPRGDSYEQKRAKTRLEKLEAAQKQSLAALTTYGWVDKTKGVARIPITEAMKLTVAELAEKKPAPANPIATPEPVAAPATSPAASPAAAASATPAAGASATPAGSPSATPAATATPPTSPKPSSVTGPDSEIRAQPAAAANPPDAAPATQPGPSSTPATSPPSAAAQAPASPSPSPSPSAPGTPLPVRGKTP